MTENKQNKTNDKMDKVIGHLENVGVENITMYLRQQGVIVNEHIGRMRVKFSLSNEALGINTKEQTDNVKDFMLGHFDLGKLTFIPKKRENELQKIEQRVRTERRNNAIGYDDKYMPLATFDKFQAKLESQKKEYLDVRDSIIAEWDEIVAEFKKNLNETLNSLGAIQKDAIYQRIVSSIPSKENYRNSFYMYASVKALPVPENLEMFSPSMQKLMTDGIQEDTLNTLNSILASSLNEATSSLNLILKSYKEKQVISLHGINSVKKAIKKVNEKNVLGHPKVEEIVSKLEEVTREKDSFDAFTIAESTVYFIYGFAKDLNLVNLLDYSNFVITKDEMENSYKYYYKAD